MVPGVARAAYDDAKVAAYAYRTCSREFDDFIGAAEWLVANKVTSPAKLSIGGGSNGGLLVGAAMTQRPDLFRAVVCQVPLLDMLRYNLLLAGASWMDEYGDPDVPEQWAYIGEYSPYQKVKAGATLPPVNCTSIAAGRPINC